MLPAMLRILFRYVTGISFRSKIDVLQCLVTPLREIISSFVSIAQLPELSGKPIHIFQRDADTISPSSMAQDLLCAEFWP